MAPTAAAVIIEGAFLREEITLPRYQLVLLDAEGEPAQTSLIDNPGARRPFVYHGQPLEEGGLIETPGGAIYLVVKQAEQDGLTRFTCRPF